MIILFDSVEILEFLSLDKIFVKSTVLQQLNSRNIFSIREFFGSFSRIFYWYLAGGGGFLNYTQIVKIQ